jgi:uncharacterized Zn finger protein
VTIEGRTIARTFWGKAWCDNLERYSDYATRLPRGRTYVRNGSVVDLQIAPGQVQAAVSGSRLYRTTVTVSAVPKARWKAICADCGGAIDSLVELLQGRLSTGVMERICRQETGLFPAPAEITFSCTCPDWASMCKHVAAVLYGVGARLDVQPELLFTLRRVAANALIAKAGSGLTLPAKGVAENVLETANLSEMFGLELATEAAAVGAPATRTRRRGAATAPATDEPVATPGRRPRAARASTAGPAVQAARPEAPPQARRKAGPAQRSAPRQTAARTRAIR